MNTDQARICKQAIADTYSSRSQTYGNSEWRNQIARKFVDYANITAANGHPVD